MTYIDLNFLNKIISDIMSTPINAAPGINLFLNTALEEKILATPGIKYDLKFELYLIRCTINI